MARALDTLIGKDKWKSKPEDVDYDFKLVLETVAEMRVFSLFNRSERFSNQKL